jgi:hypothetical protein
MAKHKDIMHALRGAMVSRPRYTTPIPDPVRQPASSPWYFTAGPVFTPGGDGAILNSKISKPWQVIYGYAYRVANPQKFTPLQPPQLYAPKGAPTVGINIQLGNEGVTTPSVNSDGTFADEGIFAYDLSDQYATEGLN